MAVWETHVLIGPALAAKESTRRRREAVSIAAMIASAKRRYEPTAQRPREHQAAGEQQDCLVADRRGLRPG